MLGILGNTVNAAAAQAQTAPTVTGVALTSAPGTDQTYAYYGSTLVDPDVVEVTVTFSGAVDITGTPQLELDFDGTPKAAACAAATNTTTMVCSYTVAENDSAPNGIAIAANKLTGGTITATGSTTVNAVLTHSAVAIDSGHKVDGIRPTLVTTGDDAPQTSTDGTQVILTFSEDIGTVTVTGFSLKTDSLHGQGAGATATISGSTVTVTLLSVNTIEYGQTVTLTLSIGAVNDTAGNRNASFSTEQAVTNNVPQPPASIDTVEITSDPGTDKIYAPGDDIEVTATFDQAVNVSGTPRIELHLGGGSRGDRWAEYSSGTGTTALVFSYAVEATDESDTDGIAVGSSSVVTDDLDLNGGTITTVATAENASLAYARLLSDSGHLVNWVRPTLSDAVTSKTDGTKVLLTFSEDLEGETVPVISGGTFVFQVKVDGTTVVLSGSTSTVSGNLVTLTLATALTSATQAVTVSYADPTSGDDSIGIQDLAGNDADSFTDQTVTNRFGLPEVSSVALTSAPGSDNTYAIGDSVAATVTFDAAVDISGSPQLELDFDGTAKAAGCATGTNTTTMACSYTVLAGDSAPNGVAIAANKLTGGTIYATGSTTVSADLDHVAVAIDTGHKVDGIRPTLVTTGSDAPTTSTDGTKVILVFSEDISAADRTEITIQADSVTAATSAESVTGTKVELTLTTALTDSTATLTVALSADAVDDTASNGNLALAATSVTNAVTTTAPTVSGIALTSTPGSDNTYAIGDAVEATVTFDAAVDITGTPQLELDFDGTAKAAGCATATNTTTMACSYTVLAGEEAPNGIAIAANKLTGGTIYATGSTTVSADLDHVAVAIDANHKVDGIRPTLITTAPDAPTTSPDGETVLLVFSEDIGAVSHSDITIQADSVNLSTTMASVAATKVEITLTTALTASATNLTVALAADAVDDDAGNGILAVAATTVTNAIIGNAAPDFSSPTATRSVPENTAANTNIGAALPAATDADNDPLTYTLEDADAASFDFNATTRQLSTKSGVTYDHETTPSYSVTLKADDSNGGSDTLAVTITITDVNEPPRAPAAPSVTATAGTTDSLDVNWTAPSNTGPTIDDYDLQYREGTSGAWTNGPQNVSGTSATIGSLTEDTSYQVQVLARNAEGESPWSLPGSGQTGAQGAPDVPHSLSATPDNRQVMLSWVQPSGGAEVTDYEYEQDVSGTWISTGSTATDYTVPNLTNGQSYTFRVRAVNSAGRSAASAPSPSVIPATAVESDRAALEALYNATGGATWTNNTNWLTTEALSEWHGVSTDANGRVTELYLTDNNLSGEIPAELGDLSNLQNLYLAENGLSGEIPAALGDLTNLQILFLADNNLSGEIPAELGDLTNLEILYLRGNELSGTIPSWLVNLTELRELSLWSNQLTGTIPPEVAPAQDRAALLVLYSATGGANWTDRTNWRSNEPLSEWHGVFTDAQGRVEELRLPANGLTGTIGAELGVLTHLQRLYLNDNELTGTIPPELENLVNLQVFDVRNTGLSCVTPGSELHTWLTTINSQGAVCATRSPGGGGGGGGGPRTSAPGAPRNLTAVSGNGEVVLSWEAPEDDGGSEITGYEYRINGRGRWISTGSTDTTHTITGLDNDTEYTFEVRAVNRIGRSRASNRTEATLPAVLDFAHFANGDGITSEIVFLNVSSHMTQPSLYFYDQEGALIDPESVVDVTVDMEVTEDGSLTVLTAMEPLGQLMIRTHGRGDLLSGSVRVVSGVPLGGLVRYSVPSVGVAAVAAGTPVWDVLFPARRQQGGIRTAAALHNLGAETVGVSCHLLSGGVALEEVEIALEANGQTSWFIEEAFTATDTSDFLGSVRCTAPGRRFTAIAVETDADQRIFTALPVAPVDRTGGGGGETVLDSAHFANGTWITDLVFLNLSAQPSGPAFSPFHAPIFRAVPVIYFYDTEGNPIAPASVVDLTDDLEVTADGALTLSSEMEPLGALTISTHGRGELLTGSVKVVSEGPIGGMFRFDHPSLGVAGVEANQPVSDVIFPVQRQEGGINTGVALHNLQSSSGLLRCELMREGVLLDAVSIPLKANGQTSWAIDAAFPATDTSDFLGTVRCSATGGDLFTAVALEMDSGARTFTALPVAPVEESLAQE